MRGLAQNQAAERSAGEVKKHAWSARADQTSRHTCGDRSSPTADLRWWINTLARRGLYWRAALLRLALLWRGATLAGGPSQQRDMVQPTSEQDIATGRQPGALARLAKARRHRVPSRGVRSAA
jgi:hypothetical protein